MHPEKTPLAITLTLEEWIVVAKCIATRTMVLTGSMPPAYMIDTFAPQPGELVILKAIGDKLPKSNQELEDGISATRPS